MNDNLNQNPLEALYEIKKMMQQSSRIFSLSGWSGIWTGLVGIVGACWMHFIIHNTSSQIHYEQEAYQDAISLDTLRAGDNLLVLDNTQKEYLIWSAFAIFFVAIIGAIFFSYRKNKKQGYTVSYNEVARKLLINLIIPIGAGAAFCAQLFQYELYFLLVPSSLIFYGLSLINASKYTFTDLKYLGLLEVLLGIGCFFVSPDLHLWVWGLGFGILHIVYGISMWYKYDRK